MSYLKSVLMDSNEGLYIDVTDLMNRLNNIRLLPKASPSPSPSPEPEPEPEVTDYPIYFWSSIHLGDTATFRAWKITTTSSEQEVKYYNSTFTPFFRGYYVNYNVPVTTHIVSKVSECGPIDVIGELSGTYRGENNSTEYGALTPGNPIRGNLSPEEEGQAYSRKECLYLGSSHDFGDGTSNKRFEGATSFDKDVVYAGLSYTTTSTDSVLQFTSYEDLSQISPDEAIKFTESSKPEVDLDSPGEVKAYGVSDSYYMKGRNEDIIIYTVELPDKTYLEVNSSYATEESTYYKVNSDWTVEECTEYYFNTSLLLYTSIPAGYKLYSNAVTKEHNITSNVEWVGGMQGSSYIIKDYCVDFDAISYNGGYVLSWGTATTIKDKYKLEDYEYLIPEDALVRTVTTDIIKSYYWNKDDDDTITQHVSGFGYNVSAKHGRDYVWKIKSSDTWEGDDGYTHSDYTFEYDTESVTLTYYSNNLSASSCFVFDDVKTTSSIKNVYMEADGDKRSVNYSTYDSSTNTYSWADGDAKYNQKWNDILTKKPYFITLAKNNVKEAMDKNYLTINPTFFSSAYTDSTCQTLNKTHRIAFCIKDSEGKMRLLADYYRQFVGVDPTGKVLNTAVVSPCSDDYVLHIQNPKEVQPNNQASPALAMKFNKDYANLGSFLNIYYTDTDSNISSLAPYFNFGEENSEYIGELCLERAPANDYTGKLDGVYIVNTAKADMLTCDTQKVYYAKEGSDEAFFDAINAKLCPLISASLTGYTK